MCQARSSCLATPALQRSMNIECWVPNVWMNKWIVSSECCRQAHLSFWQAEKLNTHTDRQTGATCAQRISLTYPVTWQEHSSKSIVCPAIHTYLYVLAHWLSSIPIHLRSAIEHRWALISSRVSRRIQHRATHRRDVPGYVFSFSFFPFPSSSLCSLPLPRYRRFSFFLM